MPFAWDRLIELIDQERVVPVVGQDVAQVEVGGRRVLAQTFVAERLAERLGVAPDPAARHPLNAVATRYLAAGGDWNDLYYEARKACQELDKLPVPTALAKLAEIRPFRLFLSTTFDSLLKRALDQIRYGGDDITRVLAITRSRAEDTSAELAKARLATVFHLFGKAVASADFTVTEEDTLEWMQSLQSETRRPQHLFQLLAGSDLLLIGNNFEDWLARFFIRTLRQQRLWLVSDCSGFVADEPIRTNNDLLGFLGRSPYVKVFTEGGPESFVDLLHAAWMAKNGASAGGGGDAPLQIDPGVVFVSYASEDGPVAESIVQALHDARLEVWFDRRELQPGDVFDPKIELAIRQSAVFIPILSRACHTDARRFFRREWHYAEGVSFDARLSTRFVNPVVVDDLPKDDPDVPGFIRARTWLEFPKGGPPPAEWVESVRQTVRAYRSQAGRGV